MLEPASHRNAGAFISFKTSHVENIPRLPIYPDTLYIMYLPRVICRLADEGQDTINCLLRTRFRNVQIRSTIKIMMVIGECVVEFRQARLDLKVTNKKQHDNLVGRTLFKARLMRQNLEMKLFNVTC